MSTCPNCGIDLGDATVVCPRCAATIDERQERATGLSFWPPTIRFRPKRAGRARRIWSRVLLLFIAALLFAGGLAASAYVGVYHGERDRQVRRADAIEEHYQAGLTALNDGRYERAAAEFAYILEIEPRHALAQQGLTEARLRLEVKPTPTLEVAQSLAEQLLEQAEASYEQQDWVATARTLTQLRALDPTHAQASVEAMLFESLYRAGREFLDEDQLEVGISYLDQAIALRPLDADVVAQRRLAVRYLDALSYWGVDWEVSIQRFEALYASAPDYKDVAQRLYQAHLRYGDLFADRGEMCPAEIQYSQALRMFSDSRLEQRRSDAAQVCLVATPAPVDGALPVLTPQPIPGFSVGRLAYPVYNGASGLYDLYALYDSGRIIRIAASADQPFWEWGTGRVVYRDRATSTIRMMLPEEGVPLQLLPAGQKAWPTFSPDSQRLAYAAAGADGIWHIYIANTDGSDEPRQLAPGWAPAWGRNGLLAYTGCDAEGVCGIILDNPDDGLAGGRLTASRQDVAASWAPGGNMLAYMSNVTGNWNLFLLSPEGAVQQLTDTPSDEGLPAWSPDGSHMAFVSNRDGNWAIYVMDLGSRDSHRILDLGSALPGWENQRLSWAP